MPNCIQKHHKHDDKDKHQIDGQRHYYVILAKHIESDFDVTRVVKFEQLADNIDWEEQQTRLVLEGLFVQDPSEGDNYLLEADGPDHHCFEVDDVLPDVVAFPVDDSEDEQHQG